MRAVLSRPAVLSAALLAVPLAAWAPAWGQESARPAETPARQDWLATERLEAAFAALGEGNPVLARVEGHEIRWRDVVASARDLPEDYRGQIAVIFPALLERLIDMRLVVAAGRAAGLAEDADIHRRVAEFEDRAISEAFIQREVVGRITTAMLRARYDAYVADLAARTEVRARHILLEREEDALAVIEALNEGADFAELAHRHSLGPTAARGGDLDYFTRDSMIPEFANAAFEMTVGEYSRVPVRTAYGWHVIKVEDRRAEEVPSFFEMRDRIRERLSREMMDELLRTLRAQADIEWYPQVTKGAEKKLSDPPVEADGN